MVFDGLDFLFQNSAVECQSQMYREILNLNAFLNQANSPLLCFSANKIGFYPELEGR